MSTQQDIYAADSESRPPMLNKENYVPWSSRLLRYAKSRPNGKLIHNSIINGPYVRRMIPEPGDTNREVLVKETFHVQIDDELTEKELKQIEANDQAIQTILLDLPEDIYATVNSCETAQEIWFTSNDEESIESYYYRFLNLMNDLKRNKHFPKKIANRRLQMVGGNGGNQFRQYAGQNVRNLNGYNAVQNVGNANQNGNGNHVAARVKGNAAGHNGNQIRCYNCRRMGIQLQAEEFDLMDAAADLDEIEEVNANYILMANLQQASTSGTQTDKAPVYDSDRSAEYTKLLEPIPKPHQVLQNDNNIIYEDSSVEQSGGTVEHPVNVKEIRALYDSFYQNLAIEVEKVNTVNRKLKETNAELTIELARFKNQEKCFEISQEKYDKLERCYQKSVYQEQCLSKRINSLHLSSGKQIMTLKEEISDHPPVVHDSEETLQL
nr:hypothetical protein [Tanacetum cinerariifolium]